MAVKILVGERLHEIRKVKNLTLRELGNMVGVSASHIGQIEKIVTNPSIELLEKLSEALEVMPADLLKLKNVSQGERLRSIREEKDLTIDDMARMLGISYFEYGEIEMGNSRLTSEQLDKLHKYCGVDPKLLTFDIEAGLKQVKYLCSDLFGLDSETTDLVVGYISKKVKG